MIASIITILSIISTFLYVYFNQYLNNGIVWWSLIVIFIVFWVIFLLGVILFLVVCTIFFPSTKRKILETKQFYSTFIYHICRLLQFFYNVRIVFENEELIPKDKPFLLASNHQSNLDPIMTYAALNKKPISYIMKDVIMKIPFVGRWLNASGFLPLDRDNDRKALEVILQAVRRLKAGYPIAVYPEGTRSKGPNVNEFRHGIFKIAQKAEVDILVIAIDGFYKVKKRFPFRRTKVLIRVCKLIPYSEFLDLHTNEIGENVKNIILENQKEARKKYQWLN